MGGLFKKKNVLIGLAGFGLAILLFVVNGENSNALERFCLLFAIVLFLFSLGLIFGGFVWV